MMQSWQQLTFLHWAYDPDVVRRLVPPPLTLDTYDGRAWVSLTPFVLANLRLPGLPPLPWISTTPETNVRTYVRGPGAEPGIWFFSLDIDRLPAMLGGRAGYWLPYMWADLDVQHDGASVRYRGRRRWPGGKAGYDVVVEPGAPFGDGELAELDHFLTARFVLYTRYGPLTASAHVEHPPWPLSRARVVRLREHMLTSAGLPAPSGEPLVHFSPGVDVRIGPPEPRALQRG
jgi:uncharacterized protein